MKKLLLIILSLMLVCLLSFSQEAEDTNETVEIGKPDAAKIGIDSSQQYLKEISVTKFEDAAFWVGNVPTDLGYITLRRLPGGTLNKVVIPEEAELGIDPKEADKNVLGVKVDFIKRGMITFTVAPIRPIPVEGIAKTFSVWVVGRNYNHTLKLVIEDYFGARHELPMGKLNFSGWKKLSCAVPPRIAQTDYHSKTKLGVKVLGLQIDCKLEETYGTYYIYFDDLRAVTDLFSERVRDIDDMSDAW